MCIDHLLCSYIIAGLNMIREMIKRWWMQLKAATNKGIEPEWQRCSRYVDVQSYVMSIQWTLYWNKNTSNLLRHLSVWTAAPVTEYKECIVNKLELYWSHFQVLLQLRRTNKAWDSFYSSVRYCVQLVSTNLWKQPEKYREQYLSMAPLYCYIAAKTYFFRQKDSCYIGPHSSVCFVYLFADLCPLLLAPEKMKCHLIPVDVSVYCFVLFCLVSVGGHLDDDMFCCCCFFLL